MSKKAEIKTRSFKYGDKNESEWPTMFGTGGRGHYYYHKEKRELNREPPPRPQNYGQAPAFISDTLKTPYYHPAACKWTDSRSELNALDRKTGSITTDKKQAPDPSAERKRARELKEDIQTSIHKAIAAVDSGNAPLSEETRALCDAENEKLTKELGIDAFNIVGHKNNAKSKRLRKYIRKR